ncbi:unnamed protein product [Plutella xylostella]|uniref:(diamondback moth) hypothetical protein n=1 Tax=Plutella xylostella TaxID=51655 RepID=A0A8S4FSB6_PLUXY|nr:unnamed protein product [Plutella xylostella]
MLLLPIIVALLHLAASSGSRPSANHHSISTPRTYQLHHRLRRGIDKEHTNFSNEKTIENIEPNVNLPRLAQKQNTDTDYLKNLSSFVRRSLAGTSNVEDQEKMDEEEPIEKLRRLAEDRRGKPIGVVLVALGPDSD